MGWYHSWGRNDNTRDITGIAGGVAGLPKGVERSMTHTFNTLASFTQYTLVIPHYVYLKKDAPS
jgi:hypothetical protein